MRAECLCFDAGLCHVKRIYFVTLRMSFRASFFDKAFTFRFDARTSRGAMKEKTSWFIKVWNSDDPSVFGVGECGPLPGLSTDDRLDLSAILANVTDALGAIKDLSLDNAYAQAREVVPAGYPAVLFAVETALLDLLHGGRRVIFTNDFEKGTCRLPINGLIWMGESGYMMDQVRDKIAQGFTCIKLKVGGLDFEKECRLLQTIRKEYSSDITIRLDANGSFTGKEPLDKLKRLAEFAIHSIEQPVRPGTSEMPMLCRESPIPIALDEELIGREEDKERLLRAIHPSFIILKPTLHGGLQHCREWIEVAGRLQIGWWITSALESNIGLNAICQFAAGYPVTLPQGLGTGSLYTTNFTSPLQVEKGTIFYNKEKSWGGSLMG